MTIENVGEQKTQYSKRHRSTFMKEAWIPWALATAVCFTACNAIIADITQKAGTECILYFASGSIVTGVIYNIYDSYTLYKATANLWNDQNLIVDGKLSLRNLIGYLAYALNYFLI